MGSKSEIFRAIVRKLLIPWWACADSNCRPLPCQGSSGQSVTDIGTENKRVTRLGFGPQMDLSPSLDLTRTSHTGAGNGTMFAHTRAVVFAFFNVVAVRQQSTLPIRMGLQRAPSSQD